MSTVPKFTQRTYEDFQPSSEWDQNEGSDTLRITLPGLKKEQIRIQMDNFGNIRVSGEHPISGNRWSRFRKDFRIPQNTSTRDIRAKFENDILSVTMPKLIAAKPQPPKVQEHPSRQKVVTEPKSTDDRDGMNQKGKSEENAKRQPNGKSDQLSEVVEARKDAQEVQKKEKDRAVEPEDKKATRDNAERDSELINSRKRESVAEMTKESFMEKAKYRVGGMGLAFNKPSQLILNVGVAILVSVGLALYMTYKLRKSIKTDSE